MAKTLCPNRQFDEYLKGMKSQIEAQMRFVEPSSWLKSTETGQNDTDYDSVLELPTKETSVR